MITALSFLKSKVIFALFIASCDGSSGMSFRTTSVLSVTLLLAMMMGISTFLVAGTVCDPKVVKIPTFEAAGFDFFCFL